jgi:hypothetical protein
MPAQGGTPQTAAKKRRATPLRPKAKTWHIPYAGQELEYVQTPLSFFEKGEFFGIVMQTLDEALERGFDLEGIAKLFGPNVLEDFRAGQLDVSQISGGFENLLTLFTRVFALVPDKLPEAYTIMLGAPPERREQLAGILRTSLTDDIGFGILDTFIEQNADDIVDFGKRWWETASKARQRLSPTTTTSEDTDD